MNKRTTLWFAAVALMAAACGGGGGGGTPAPGPTYNSVALTASAGGAYVDIRNLKPGQTVQLQLIGLDEENNPTVISGTTWTTNAPSSVVTLSGSTLTAVGPSASNYTVTTSYNGETYTATVGVRNGLATVSGRIRTQDGANVANVQILYYDATGTIVGSIRSNANGTFSSNVPTTATRFAATTEGLVGYLDQFGFGGKEYTVEVTDCTAPLPALTAGTSTALSSNIVVRVSDPDGPPPPPPGCFND